jgi:hypothetical protein
MGLNLLVFIYKHLLEDFISPKSKEFYVVKNLL